LDAGIAGLGGDLFVQGNRVLTSAAGAFMEAELNAEEPARSVYGFPTALLPLAHAVWLEDELYLSSRHCGVLLSVSSPSWTATQLAADEVFGEFIVDGAVLFYIKLSDGQRTLKRAAL
jgi:hypothetical protein